VYLWPSSETRRLLSPSRHWPPPLIVTAIRNRCRQSPPPRGIRRIHLTFHRLPGRRSPENGCPFPEGAGSVLWQAVSLLPFVGLHWPGLPPPAQPAALPAVHSGAEIGRAHV